MILLLHALGGIDLQLIALCYVSVASSILFLSALAIWISAEAPGVRLAYAAFLLTTLAWTIGPFCVSLFSPGFGIRMPEWVAAANSWLVASSPIVVAFHVAVGSNSWAQLSVVVGRMIALQLLGAVVLTVGAIARLRSAHAQSRAAISVSAACQGGVRSGGFGVAVRSEMIRYSGGRCIRLVAMAR